MQSTWKQILLIIIGLGLVAFIFFKGKNNPSVLIEKERTLNTGVAENTGFDTGLFILQAKEMIGDSMRIKVEDAENNLAENKSDTFALLNIAKTWDEAGFSGLSAIYFEDYAGIRETERAYLKAANKYFEAQKTAKDSLSFRFFSSSSLALFEKVLELNPDNLNAKADYAIAYMEYYGTSPEYIMKGVGLLKEVEQVDPENEKALFYLSMLSIRSGQYEKARERLNKLVELQPENPFVYRYLGQVYLSLNEKEKALEAFLTYKEKLKDPVMKEDAGQMIEKIKNL